MSLLSLNNVSLAFGIAPVLRDANLAIEPKQRICIIGRNGAGKSSLLKLINQELLPDSGEIVRQSHLRVGKLIQEIPQDLTGSIYDIVAQGLGEQGELLKQYHQLNEQLAENPDEASLKKLQQLQQQIEHAGAWQVQQRVDTIISKMSLNADDLVQNLSGGMIRRVLLAQALVTDPDILLLDEPTNHLDVSTIEWLEDFLLGYSKTIVFITHDRSLLKKLATQIVEIDHGRLQVWDCDYEKYLVRKAEQLAAEETANQLFEKRLAQEEQWIRKGIQARRTRNEGRVRRLQEMRREKAQMQQRQGKVNLQQHNVNSSGKVVFEIEGLSYDYDNKPIIKDFTATILRGDKIAILGDNGCGKSTFLKLLLDKLQPDAGKIKCGTKLEVSYFDQKRQQLNEELSVVDNVAEHGDTITINGKSQHVMSYLGDFLFTPERARTPVKALSGGERHRLLLAKIFTKPSNLLILDEPTNDLDAETLELLEERLIDYQGTLLLVSHDREFVNNVVTSTIVFSNNGVLTQYVGDYNDYLRQKPDVISAAKPKAKVEKAKSNKLATKLSYKDQRELAQLPGKIEQLEADIAKLQDNMSHPDFYQQDAAAITKASQQLETLETELTTAYQRWEILEP